MYIFHKNKTLSGFAFKPEKRVIENNALKNMTLEMFQKNWYCAYHVKMLLYSFTNMIRYRQDFSDCTVFTFL